MKWSDCAGTYKAFVSLGSTCQTAYQLKRLGLRKFAGPLDWFVSPSVPDVARLIQNRFTNFFELNRLQLLGTDLDCYVVRDAGYGIVSYHDFPLSLPEYRWTDAYYPFKQKMDRRVKAFLSMAAVKPICLIRTQTSRSEAEQLRAALNSVMPGKFRLIIVNNADVHEVRHEDWGLADVCSVSVPKGADWKGSDRAWDEIMKGFKLAPGPRS
ncbi:hypothetical protein SD70_14130 [Gordoniibacillus kamchatkensis]|uniref:Peptidase n=1 Tax=Gordoniibacillus kamchatkensis TaxID=1590651 RepID=A0ABR5AHF5_9BACL|nr:DUF1796 family putative cysteine peptidase [Paenibacillus sp. VKM B-2647]KIL40370.1 hypothetical protein SD70_14130 [Paenibacillus sp. VKM B-2647]